jgi:hypothetical protein
MLNKFLKIVLILALFFIISQKEILAARSLSIESVSKNNLFGDEDLTITASASGFTEGEAIYIKGAFYLDTKTNYFGFTKNGDTWIKNSSTTTTQRQIKVGEWDNKLIVKTDFTDSGYMGENSYKLKLGYYYLTAGGNLSAINWTTNSVDLDISEPDPTPTPSPTPSSTPSKNPSSIKSPTLTPSASTISPAKFPTIYSVKSASKSASISAIPTSILGVSNKSTENINKTKYELNKKVLVNSANRRNITYAAVTIGSILILTCGILVYHKIRKNRHV